MLNKRFGALTALLLTMAVATPEMAGPAVAFPLSQGAAIGGSGINPDNTLLSEVRDKWYPRRKGYNNYYGGNRHHYRRHRHNNNWPYIGLGFGLGYGLGYGGGYYNNRYYGDRYYGGGGGHVEWCLNRYRSYNPRTDTFMGYDGYRHRCNSPYG